MKTNRDSKQAGWVRRSVRAMWMACVATCAAAAGAQGYTVPQTHYHVYSTAAAQGEGVGQGGQSEVKDDLFAGTDVFAKNAIDVTEITMDPQTLDLVGGRDAHRAHSMVLNVVRTYEYDKPGMYNMADVDAFRNKLNSADWRCSVHVRDLKTGESTDVCNKQRSDDLVETAIITVEPKQLTFIHTIRKRGAGQSELGELPMIFSGTGAPVIAMLEPGLMNLQMSLGRLNMIQPQIDMELNSAKMKQRMAEVQKQMNSPEFRKQMQEMQKQLKNMKLPELAPLPPVPPAPPAAPELPKLPE